VPAAFEVDRELFTDVTGRSVRTREAIVVAIRSLRGDLEAMAAGSDQYGWPTARSARLLLDDLDRENPEDAGAQQPS